MTSTMFVALLNTLFSAKCGLDQKHLYPKNEGPNIKDGEEFDFIVVGAGSAGSVVANRLSENPNWKVLLLEAGDYPSTDTEIPYLFNDLQRSSTDWQYTTEPSPTSCQGFESGRCAWPRGKTLGGSSSINAMIYIRGNRLDYDQWESLGNPTWNWKTALRYFKKSESLRSPDYTYHKHHGQDGYLRTILLHSAKPQKEIFLSAARQAGFHVENCEGADCSGFHECLNTIHGGQRWSAGKAFLQGLRERSNFYLSVNSTAVRILLANREAYGVAAHINGRTIRLKAKHEVVVSAGAVASPQLLMLSGIGPKRHLENKNIEVHTNLPVGMNLQDHIALYGVIIRLDPSFLKSYDKHMNVLQYFTNYSGPFSTIGMTNLLWFFSTYNSTYPNIQVHHLLFPQNDQDILPRYLYVTRMNERSKRSILKANKNYVLVAMLITLLKPKSRGRILLNSCNAKDSPEIYSGYFTDENNEDLQTLLATIPYVNKLITAPALAQYNAQVLEIDVPNCDTVPFDTEKYWTCNIRSLASTMHHQTSTCKMGIDGVVNSRLRVHGIQRLRVIDASIMPEVVSGNTNAPTIMIGEKGADMIKEDWGQYVAS